jgi:hypothetical protein
MLFGKRSTPEAFVFYCKPKEVRNMRKIQPFLRVSLMFLALSSLLFAGCSTSDSDDNAPVFYEAYDGNNKLLTKAETFTHYEVSGPVATLASAGLSDIKISAALGKFPLTLKTEIPVASVLAPITLPLSVTVSDTSAKVFWLPCQFFNNSIRTKTLTYMNPSYIGGGSVVCLVYADKAVNVAGADTTNQQEQVIYSLKLVKGWNWVISVRNGSTGTTTNTSKAPGDAFKWFVQ